MPLYEFFCAKCNRRFEKLCSSSRKEGIECPQCGSEAKRVFSTFNCKTGSGGSASAGGSSCSTCSLTDCTTCR
ncbi:MAG: zinc ribbon domain-containing protein [Firmicutes bacterium]|nr:zinc ribbon domain-containing protein [Bacillota bacterium]